MVHDIARSIALNIKSIRIKNRLTLRELSNLSNISVSMLSKIENSQTLPSIATYSKLATALKVQFSDLMAKETRESSLVRADERPIISQGPYTGSLLAFKKSNKKMEPFIFSYPYAKKFPKHRHNNEEMIFILRGAIEFKYGDQIMLLREGDCFYYHGSVEHGGRALDKEGATAIVVQSSLELLRTDETLNL